MSPDLSAQIIAKAWSDESFAQALRGLDPYTAIKDTLGVTLPAGTPLPEIPPGALEGATMGIRVHSAVRAGWSVPVVVPTGSSGWSWNPKKITGGIGTTSG